MARLDGKVALITGAAQGMGEAEARLFVREGARVVITDVLDERGQALAAELGAAATFEHLNVAKMEDWERVAESVQSTHGALHVLINNAAISHYARIEDAGISDLEKHFRVNQLGPWMGMKTTLDLLTASAPASIINIASAAGARGAYGGMAYGSSKAALISMTQSAAIEFGPRNVRVNAILPGGIATEMARKAEEEWMGGELAPIDVTETAGSTEVVEESGWQLPLRRMGQPEEIANMALFLASEESSYCTGAEFVVDGGLLTGLPFAAGGKNGPQKIGNILDA